MSVNTTCCSNLIIKYSDQIKGLVQKAKEDIDLLAVKVKQTVSDQLAPKIDPKKVTYLPRRQEFDTDATEEESIECDSDDSGGWPSTDQIRETLEKLKLNSPLIYSSPLPVDEQRDLVLPATSTNKL